MYLPCFPCSVFPCLPLLPIQGSTHYIKPYFFLICRLSLSFSSLSPSQNPEGQIYSALCTVFLMHSLSRHLLFIKQEHQPEAQGVCYLRHTFLVNSEVHLSSYVYERKAHMMGGYDKCGCISLFASHS